MKRRTFIKTGMAGLATAYIPLSSTLFAQDVYPDAVWVDNGEPEQLLKTALKELGGMKRFISKGDVVVVKPNIGWDKAPEYAANTNPDLVHEVVLECLKAGARKVKVFDRTCNIPRRCYKSSQIQEKAEDAGAEVTHMRENKYKSIPLKNSKKLVSWEIYEEYLEADKVINVPIAKHHSLDHVSLGLKNLMGVMGGDRGSLHSGFESKIIDIDSEILPTLTIIDAYRMLLRNGPRGGNLNDVKLQKTLIASSCIVTADFLALRLFGHKPGLVGHVQEAINRGINKFDPQNLNLRQVDLA